MHIMYKHIRESCSHDLPDKVDIESSNCATVAKRLHVDALPTENARKIAKDYATLRQDQKRIRSYYMRQGRKYRERQKKHISGSTALLPQGEETRRLVVKGETMIFSHKVKLEPKGLPVKILKEHLLAAINIVVQENHPERQGTMFQGAVDAFRLLTPKDILAIQRILAARLEELQSSGQLLARSDVFTLIPVANV